MDIRSRVSGLSGFAPLVLALALGLGSLATAAPCGGPDTDGDGVPDACDNCPSVSNPSVQNHTKLNGPLVAGGNVDLAFRVTPDGATLVYRADQDTDEAIELFSVPVTGGTPVKLNDPLVSGGDLLAYDISADSSTVVYICLSGGQGPLQRPGRRRPGNASAQRPGRGRRLCDHSRQRPPPTPGRIVFLHRAHPVSPGGKLGGRLHRHRANRSVRNTVAILTDSAPLVCCHLGPASS